MQYSTQPSDWRFMKTHTEDVISWNKDFHFYFKRQRDTEANTENKLRQFAQNGREDVLPKYQFAHL